MRRENPTWTDKQKGPYLDREQLDKFYEKVRKIARKEFGVDCDGDLPIDITMIDRTRYERSYYFPVFYDHQINTPEEWDSIVRALMGNLEIASDQLTRWHRCREYHPRPGVETATDNSLTVENRALVERNITVEGELDRMRRDVGAKIRIDETVKDARARRNAMEEALQHLWHCNEKDCDECEKLKERFRLEGKKPRKRTGAAPSSRQSS